MELIKTWQWILALIAGLLFFIVFSAFYGFWTYIRPERLISHVTPKDFRVDYQDINLTTDDGLKLSAWFIPAVKTTSKAILLLHGYPADKGDILSSMIFLRQDYNLLFLDFRYFGESQGRYSTVGVKETQDVLAAIKYLQEAGMDKIGIWGFSMGAAAALMALPQTNHIDAVVSESSYATLDLMAEEVYRQVPGLNKIIARLMNGAVKLFLDINVREQSPLEAVRQVRVPILFIHSPDDKVIPFAQAEMLRDASASNPNAEFWFREKAGHGFLDAEEYNQKIKGFFTITLGAL